jgi:hypothetical protein
MTKKRRLCHTVARLSVLALHHFLQSEMPLRRLEMANFVRSATIILMGSTVMAAGVLVVLYS